MTCGSMDSCTPIERDGKRIEVSAAINTRLERTRNKIFAFLLYRPKALSMPYNLRNSLGTQTAVPRPSLNDRVQSVHKHAVALNELPC